LLLKGISHENYQVKSGLKTNFYMDVGGVVFNFDQVPPCNVAVEPVSVLPRKPVWVLKGQ
jgi:hypothetical protein